MQIIRSRTLYDVCIVGSGAGGGMAAKVLTESGANVVMLEAGPMWNPSSESYMLQWTYDSPRRGAATEKQQFGEFDAAFGGWTLEGEPYTNGTGSTFDWFRSRMLGGRTNHWGRISLRFGPDDFRRKSLDGLGDDWPITYEDMKPFYDRVDSLVGIFGTKEGLPNDPDGIFLPPPKPRCYELLIKQAADKLKVTCIASRLSILTQPLNGRMACHYCGQCGRGCAVHANFSSPSVLIPPAMATKKLTIVANAMAREVTVDETGRATGVAYIDKSTGRENHVQARIVVLAASACESARILLNSKSAKFPHGLGNSSGNVGKYLTDTTGLNVQGFIPKLMSGVPHNEDGVGGMHIFMPWWGDNKKLDFPRGYHIEPGGGRGMPSFGFMGGVHNHVRAAAQTSSPGYGKTLKDDYRRFYGATVGFSGRGEMIPNKDSYMEIDPAVVDKWGIPVPRFHFKFYDYEVNQAKHMQETFRALIAEMGGTPLTEMPTRERQYGLAPGGRIIHELGVTRMGNDASTSVLNKNCQAHDCRNVFVADAGPFVSQPDKNCTWTILALAMRTSEFIVQERKAGGFNARGSGLKDDAMENMNRRALLKILSAAPVAASFALTEAEAQQAHHLADAAVQTAQQTGVAFTPKFFTPSEYQTVRILSDLIIPTDDRSGGAIAAGVPEFMDFTMVDQPARQLAMRGGLAWLDLECQRRFDKTFVAISDADRHAVLADLATYGELKPGLTHGQAFFRSFRDLTATGFWTTKMGITDLGYMGNTVVAKWDGCPPEALKKLGL